MAEFERALQRLKEEVAKFITANFEAARLCPGHKISLGERQYLAAVGLAGTLIETQQAVSALEGFLETLRSRAQVQEAWGGYLTILRKGRPGIPTDEVVRSDKPAVKTRAKTAKRARRKR